MTLLIVGLMLFLGIHLVPVFPGVRLRWLQSWGERHYKGVFAAVALIGIVLIVMGYRRAPPDIRWFDPFPLAVYIAPAAMIVSFILLAAANMRTHIRMTLQHPMLIGVGIWSLVHLLANGEARATVLFGSVLAYVLIDLASAIARHAVRRFEPAARYDAMAVAGGIVAALLVMLFHAKIFGVAATSWSL